MVCTLCITDIYKNNTRFLIDTDTYDCRRMIYGIFRGFIFVSIKRCALKWWQAGNFKQKAHFVQENIAFCAFFHTKQKNSSLRWCYAKIRPIRRLNLVRSSLFFRGLHKKLKPSI